MRLRLFLKISMMVLALAAVFYSMHYLSSGQFEQKMQSSQSAMGVLLGTSDIKPHNWCPNPIHSLQLYSSDPAQSATLPLTTAVDQAALCEVLMEPLSQDDMEESFRPVLRAIPQKGDGILLEQNAKGVFRVQGMPFRSSSLEKALKRYEF